MNKSMLVFFLTVCLSLAPASLLHAVPAYPYKILVKTNAGHHVSIKLRGDEYFKYALSEDGYTLVQQPAGWFYATQDTNGLLIASPYALMPYDAETDSLKAFKKSLRPHILPIADTRETAANQRIVSAYSSPAHPVTGNRRALVILMQFTNVKMKHTAENFERLFNETAYCEDGAAGSVRDFYAYASDGQLDYQADVFGPYTTTYDMAHYGANNAQSYDRAPLQMVMEAINRLPNDIDLSVYDYDGDGKVDNVHIIYAGYGEEAGAPSDAIWAHEYPYELPISKAGMRFHSYSCSPELRSNSGENLSRIGVICHELGHALGTMDYYDTDYATGGSYKGTGMWDLMASGSWNNGGISPANFNPYSRAYDFGWTSAPTLDKSGTYILPSHAVLRIETGSPDDYYLLENRTQSDFDSALPGSGLLIYHHHPSFDTEAARNTLNTTHPQCFYPVCASLQAATPIISSQYGDINSAECPFKVTGGVVFSASTTPAAFAWDGTDVGFELACIGQETTGELILHFKSSAHEEPDNSEPAPVPVYTESFEQGLNGFTENIKSGSTSWEIYPGSPSFVVSGDIPKASDGTHHLQLYVGSKGSPASATLQSPAISLHSDSSYILSFDYRFWNPTGTSSPLLTADVILDNGASVIPFTTDETSNEWHTSTIRIPKGTTTMNYRFTGKVQTGGIFIDNIRLYQETVPTSVGTPPYRPGLHVRRTSGGILIRTDKETSCSIYTVGGTRVCSDIPVGPHPVSFHLSRGIYILLTADGTHQTLAI